MKKTLLLVIAIMAGLTGFAQITDTIVSTIPSNRNVLIEEYTGINCGWCPAGHKKANEVKAAHPDRVNIINIHQGSYSANTFTTQWGNALANQIGLTGYPAGTVNRHVFSQYSSVLDVYRDYWPSCANTILGMSSPVNIAAEGTLDMSTRTVNIRVQLYYTGSQTVTSNALNVAILQDNVLGSQAGMSMNPAQVDGSQYTHMHMLRHLITGQWGETIDSITPGTLVEKNYEYVIPAQLGSPNAIEAVLSDLSFIAFVCEGHKEVLTSIEVPIERINLPALSGRIVNLNETPSLTCDDQANAYFRFMNQGSETVTSLTYTYGIGSNTQTATWNGSVSSFDITNVDIPTFNLNLNVNNTLSVKITQINGVDVDLPTKTLSMKKNVHEGAGTMTLVLKTDNYGSETTFKIFGPEGNVVLSGGPFTNSSAEHTFTFAPTTLGCYRLEVYDSEGDGINSGYGTGWFKLMAEDGTQIFRDNGKFGSKATYMIDVRRTVGIEEYTSETAIYPNPATDMINISTDNQVQRVEIFNMQGQLVKVETGEVTRVSVKDLANGLYTLKLTTDNGTSMHKIIKK
ncbi:MAG: Omp28-related outer membrane protein [Bacteroidales bacterium]|nr:Omp28-related outer membrane protein [Bacteroidales bacterium]